MIKTSGSMVGWLVGWLELWLVGCFSIRIIRIPILNIL